MGGTEPADSLSKRRRQRRTLHVSLRISTLAPYSSSLWSRVVSSMEAEQKRSIAE
jgi:hypothetical protein